MIHARIHHGVVELQDPIPESWEGRIVKLVPLELAPDDDIPDLEERLAALHALGPMEYEPGERAEIEKALREMDEYSRRKMQRLAEQKP